MPRAARNPETATASAAGEPRVERGGAAEAGEVERQHVTLGGEPVEHGVPHAVIGPQRVQENQRPARAASQAGDHHVSIRADVPSRISA